MSVWQNIIIAVVALAVILVVLSFLPFPGRYEVILAQDPGKYGRFLLLDTWDGDVYDCDRTGCLDEPIN